MSHPIVTARTTRILAPAAVLLVLASLLAAGEGPGVAELIRRGHEQAKLSAPSAGEHDYTAAANSYREAMDHPDATPEERATAFFYLGVVLGRQERYEEAASALTRWLVENPGDKRRQHVRYFLGLYETRLGREADARRTWAPILTEAPDSDYARLVRRHLVPSAPPAGEKETPSPDVRKAVTSTKAPRSAGGGGYVVVVTAVTLAHEGFREVAAEIALFHEAKTVEFDGKDFDGLAKTVAELRPENVLFVVPPDVLDVPLHRRLLLLSTGLDDDMFTDYAFGYFTAKDGDALAALWERTKKLHEEGLSKKDWVATSVTSGSKSFESATIPDPARAAGFSGAHLYFGFPEKDPGAWEFIDKGLSRLEGAGVITMTGNGDPEGIWVFPGKRNLDPTLHWPYDPEKVGHDPKGEMPRITADRFRALSLARPIVWSGTCHSGAPRRVFVEGDIVSTFGKTEHATVHRLPPEKSLCLALLDAGAAAFLCPLGANHGYSVSLETEFALTTGASLGETIKSTYDDVCLAAGGTLRLDIPEEGKAHRRTGPIMQGGGSNRVLIGDPALRPFDRAAHPSETVTVEKTGERTFRVTVDWKDGHHWRAWDIYGTDRERLSRVFARIALDEWVPADRDVSIAARVTATGADGKAMPFALTRVVAESFHGRRFLFLQANAPRPEVNRKAVTAVFEVTWE